MTKERTRHKKSTTLTVTFVDSVTKGEDAMGIILKEFGCPKADGEEVDDGWNLYSGQNKCHLADSKVMDFLKENCPEVVIEKATKIKVDLDDWHNKDHLQELFEKVTEEGKHATYTLVETKIDWISSTYISLYTTGNGVSATKVENIHRKNVLALKDKLVAHRFVQSVAYTCRWEHVKSEECVI